MNIKLKTMIASTTAGRSLDNWQCCTGRTATFMKIGITQNNVGRGTATKQLTKTRSSAAADANENVRSCRA